MKLREIAVALSLTGMTSLAFAGTPGSAPASVAAAQATVSACTPPNGGTGHACDGYDRFLRAHFTTRQIGMLFGYESSYPEYLSGGIRQLRQRYDRLMRQYVDGHGRAGNGTRVAVTR